MQPTRKNEISGRCGIGLPYPPRIIQSNNEDDVHFSNENQNEDTARRKVGKPATGQPRIDGGAVSEPYEDSEEFWKISGWTMFEGSRLPHSRNYMKLFGVPWSIRLRNNSCVFTTINQYFGECLYNSYEDVYDQNKEHLGYFRHGKYFDYHKKNITIGLFQILQKLKYTTVLLFINTVLLFINTVLLFINTVLHRNEHRTP
jgi:hypothetical protein